MRPQNWIYTIPLRIRSLFKRSAADSELDEELQYHLDQKTQEFISKGLSEKDAHYAALREFDGLQQSKENCRDARKVNWIQDLAQDLRFGARTLRKNPGFAAVAILTLAIGIGANTAIFSVVHAVLIQSLPYPNANRLAIIWSAWGNEARGPASGPEVDEMRKRSKLFEEISGIWVTTGTIAGEGEPEQIRLAQVTANFMPLVADRPQLGRFFSADEERAGGPPAMIITDGLWRRQYGADASIVGKRVRVGNGEYTVVGVMPRDFKLIFPDDSNVPPDVDVFTTLRGDLAKFSRTTGYIRMLGRLRPSATFAQAQQEADGIASQLRAAYKDFSDQDLRIRVVSLQADDVRNVRHSLLALFGGVGLVLLIACVNVANLLLARATGRTREITVRTALGASATRLIRQMLTESILLSAAGGALALGV
jgi:putative ABC transport system permease protein